MREQPIIEAILSGGMRGGLVVRLLNKPTAINCHPDPERRKPFPGSDPPSESLDMVAGLGIAHYDAAYDDNGNPLLDHAGRYVFRLRTEAILIGGPSNGQIVRLEKKPTSDRSSDLLCPHQSPPIIVGDSNPETTIFDRALYSPTGERDEHDRYIYVFRGIVR